MSDNNYSGGIGFFGFLAAGLTIVFVTLKLIGVINWNWWLVVLPCLIYIGLCILLFLFVIILGIIAILLD